MTDKHKILESWIMVEHLSEGDIRLKDQAVLTLDDLQRRDFWSLFLNEMKKKKWKPWQKGGIVIYFDIFKFQEVVDILRKQYDLEPTDEDIRFGNKFSFALYFDRDLNLLPDMTFFTESAYIRRYKKVPYEKEFREFEETFKNQVSQDFADTAQVPEKFNGAMEKALARYGIKVADCRMQVLGNIETEATNLHSFFIDDLENAKNIETVNLNTYLFGYQKDRVNLDSKKDSENFRPYVFEQILQPKNYPLGRFPSKTMYALSLMQQVAVNLSIGFDTNPIRSVNGPPGTGKTTLLKDIFAQFIVQQAYDMSKLSERFIKGTKETIYFKSASIGKLPDNITENSIVVASSNNGAVQNIVNELPLNKAIDESLIEELKAADYFREISNAKLSAKWQEDESGKKKEVLEMESVPGEEKFWGVFSLEGGKSDNMANILTNMKHICKYLEEEYEPDPEIYDQFLMCYEEVMKLGEKGQAFADSSRGYVECQQQLDEASANYYSELAKRSDALDAELKRSDENEQTCRHDLEQLEFRLKEVLYHEETVQRDKGSMDQCLKAHQGQKPGFFAGRRKKEEYNDQLREITAQIVKLNDESSEYRRQEQEIRNRIRLCQLDLTKNTERKEELLQKFQGWKGAEESKISTLEEKVREYETIRSAGQGKPLDMNQKYEDLQMSNPWFDENYRIAQSKLFIMALRVRKQFLYENRKNVKAAVIIWGQQEKYLEQKSVIKAAWNWINLTIPVISSTFASFSRMCRNLEPNTLGHLFIDEAGQALPQAAVGAIYRSRHVMAVGDPMQIQPVLTLNSNILSMLSRHFGVLEKYLSASASVQSLADEASRYGFYRKQDPEEAWIGIPLWVHRRCRYPMFTISNVISYNGLMVQGIKKNGKADWFDIGGTASNKYVEEQGEFLLQKIMEMAKENPKILDKKEKDVVFVITPFANAAYQLSRKLGKFFTRYDEHGRPTNIGTVHTFQGKEAPIVFFVLGADKQSTGAARWAVSEANIMNVAATRAKEEFYIIGDRKLYLGLNCDVVTETDRIIRKYKRQYPEFVKTAGPVG
ncbi:MAG TPA: ATP-binding protein [Candidatus Scybalocola faecavium]|nr:ATP-binding protein [Candidatus Scybalocola faecavium]